MPIIKLALPEILALQGLSHILLNIHIAVGVAEKPGVLPNGFTGAITGYLGKSRVHFNNYFIRITDKYPVGCILNNAGGQQQAVRLPPTIRASSQV